LRLAPGTFHGSVASLCPERFLGILSIVRGHAFQQRAGDRHRILRSAAAMRSLDFGFRLSLSAFASSHFRQCLAVVRLPYWNEYPAAIHLRMVQREVRRACASSACVRASSSEYLIGALFASFFRFFSETMVEADLVKRWRALENQTPHIFDSWSNLVM
jgi:hypothetical protein